jgi:3-deoxy-D-manno-octulosonic-acid transferase
MGIIYIFSIPILIFLSKRRVKYKESIKARFFLKDNPPLSPNGVWFHSCSYGEARAIYPILDNFSTNILRLTTTTQTGYRAISQKSPKNSRYLPFEILLFSWLKPQKVLVVVEAELWYMLFFLAKRRGAKTLLINARISERSFPKYRKFRWIYRKIFENIDEVYAQTNIDKKRLESIGAKNISVIGNIKLFNIPKATRELSKPKALLICAGSTHEGEEEIILKAFLDFKKIEKNSRLIIAPRHPERFKKVVSLVEDIAKENHFSWHRFSENEAFNSDIVVVDILGELVNIYAISDIVILGGAFEPHGGHNFAEPAQFGVPIISGEHYFNQVDIFNMVDGIRVVSKERLKETLLDYENLKKSRIIKKTDINPILKSIKRELESGKSV